MSERDLSKWHFVQVDPLIFAQLHSKEWQAFREIERRIQDQSTQTVRFHGNGIQKGAIRQSGR